MERLKVLTLIGGISKGSINKKLYHAVRDLGLESFEFETFEIEDLPYFSQDLENDPPDIVEEFKDRIRSAEAILFITPEYNRSIPGVLKNAIDWGSRPFGKNLWTKMPAAIMGASASHLGTSVAQSHLRQVMMGVGLNAMTRPEIYLSFPQSFTTSGVIKEESTKVLLVQFLDAFKNWIIKLNGPQEIVPLFHKKDELDSPKIHH